MNENYYFIISFVCVVVRTSVAVSRTEALIKVSIIPVQAVKTVSVLLPLSHFEQTTSNIDSQIN